MDDEVALVCELCSTSTEPVYLKKLESLDICPNTDCCYCFQLWDLTLQCADYIADLPEVIAKTLLDPKNKDVNATPELSSLSVNIPMQDGVIAQGTKPTHEEENEEMDISEDVCIQSASQNHIQVVLDAQENVSNVVDIIEVPIKDGISSAFQSFINWPNRDAYCWLNSTLALLVHSGNIKRLLDSKPLADCQMGKVFYEYQHILEDINKPTVSNMKMADTSKQLHSMQENVRKFIQPFLRFVKAQANSPAQTLPLLLKENPEIKEMFEFNHEWKLNCGTCCTMSVSQGIKTVIPVPEVTDEFSMKLPWGLATCKKCLTSDQRRNLSFTSLPKVVILHFEKGFTNGSVLQYDFEYQEQKYMVKGLILYTDVFEQKHFVTYIRDLRSNRWLNCDDLQPGFHTFSSDTPRFKPSEIHIIMWERVTEHIAEENVIKTPLKRRNTVANENATVRQRAINLPLSVKTTEFPIIQKIEVKRLHHSLQSQLIEPAVKGRKKTSNKRVVSSRPPTKKSKTANPTSNASDLSSDNVDENLSMDTTAVAEESSKQAACKGAPRFPGIKLPAVKEAGYNFSPSKTSPSVFTDSFTCKSIEEIEHFQVVNQSRVVLQDYTRQNVKGYKVTVETPKISLQNSPSSPPLSEKAPLSTPGKVVPDMKNVSNEDANISEYIEPDGTKIQVFNSAQIQESDKEISEESINAIETTLITEIQECDKKQKKTAVNRKGSFNLPDAVNNHVNASRKIGQGLKPSQKSIKQIGKNLSIQKAMRVAKESSDDTEVCSNADTTNNQGIVKKKRVYRSKFSLEYHLTNEAYDDATSSASEISISLPNKVNPQIKVETKKGRPKKSNKKSEVEEESKAKPSKNVKKVRQMKKNVSSKLYDLRKDPKSSEKGKTMGAGDPESDWIRPPSDRSMSEISDDALTNRKNTAKTNCLPKRKARKKPLESGKNTVMRKKGNVGEISQTQANTDVGSEGSGDTSPMLEKSNITCTSDMAKHENVCEAKKDSVSEATISPSSPVKGPLTITGLQLAIQDKKVPLSPRIIGTDASPRIILPTTIRMPLNAGIRMAPGSPMLPPGTRIHFRANSATPRLQGNLPRHILTLPSDTNNLQGPIFLIQQMSNAKPNQDNEVPSSNLITENGSKQTNLNSSVSFAGSSPIKNVLVVQNKSTPDVNSPKKSPFQLVSIPGSNLGQSPPAKISPVKQSMKPEDSHTSLKEGLELSQKSAISKKSMSESPNGKSSPQKAGAKQLEKYNTQNFTTHFNDTSQMSVKSPVAFPNLMNLGNGVTLTPLSSPSIVKKPNVSSAGAWTNITPVTSLNEKIKLLAKRTESPEKESPHVIPPTPAKSQQIETARTAIGTISEKINKLAAGRKLEGASEKHGNNLKLCKQPSTDSETVKIPKQKPPQRRKKQGVSLTSAKSFSISEAQKNTGQSPKTVTVPVTRVSSRLLVKKETIRWKDSISSSDDESSEMPVVTPKKPSACGSKKALSALAKEPKPASTTSLPKTSYFDYAPSPILSQLYNHDDEDSEKE